MKLTVYPYFLKFIRPFALAHGTRSGTQLAFIKIEHEGIVAFGEASLPPYLDETYDSVKKWVATHEEELRFLLDLNPFEHKTRIPFSKENPAAASALQTAILNWYAASKEMKIGDFFNHKQSKPELALTITKNDFDYLDEKLELAKHFTHLKLKLTGSDDDIEFVRAIRKRSELPFCIDANQGYQKKEKAVKLISFLEILNCVLIEQPLKASDHDGHYWLKQRLEVPIIADESIRLFDDLVQYSEAYSGVNIKLMKCGGIIQAQKMLDYKTADKHFIKLIGCMTESTLGVSTSAILASQVTMADLDAPYLINNDPFSGFQIRHQKIEMDKQIRLKPGFNF